MSYYGNNNANDFYNHVKIKNEKQQPLDTVQDICMDPFNNNEHGFLAGGWDGILRYGRVKGMSTDELEIPFDIFLQHPIVAVAMGRNNIAFAGLTTGDIVAVDMANNQNQIIGGHQNTPICKLFWIQNLNILLSFGYDQKMKFWNLANDNGNFLASEFDLPFKTHTAAFDFPYIMIGTGQGKMGFISLNTLPNLKIPDNNGWFDIVQFGSKFTCSVIKANAKLYAFGCADGRTHINNFEENYNGIRPCLESPRKMYSKAQKKQSAYSHSPSYCQANDIDIGFEGNKEYLVISGTEEISFFNLYKREKTKRIKARGTCGKLSLDCKFFIYADGNDWLEGVHEWKKTPIRPKIEAIKFTTSEIDAITKSADR